MVEVDSGKPSLLRDHVPGYQSPYSGEPSATVLLWCADGIVASRRNTLAAAVSITSAVELGRPDQWSSHSVTNRSLACMSTCRSCPVPEFTNLCGTPAGTTTTALHLDRLVPGSEGGGSLLHHEGLLVGVPLQLRAAPRGASTTMKETPAP
jgi:hypothetical protein